MKEIEIKVLEVDKEKIIHRLESIGAKKVFDGKLESTSFDYADNRLSKEGKLLRFRFDGEKYFLTFKDNVEESELKVRDETEIEINEEIVKILHKLGLKETIYHEKYRVSYIFKDIRFEIDTFPEAPTFVEIEAPDEKRVKDGLELLGFNMTQVSKKGATEILEDYGIEIKNLKFKEDE